MRAFFMALCLVALVFRADASGSGAFVEATTGKACPVEGCGCGSWCSSGTCYEACTDSAGGQFGNTITRFETFFCHYPYTDQLAEPPVYQGQYFKDCAVSANPNLIVNGNAEAGTITGWTVTLGDVASRLYAETFEHGSWVNEGDEGRRGERYFHSPAFVAASEMEQVVPLCSYSELISEGTVTADIGGWFGGFGTQHDQARMEVTWRDATNTAIGSAVTLGPVTRADRGMVSKLMFRSEYKSPVPSNADNALVKIIIDNRNPGPRNQGSADDLFLRLRFDSPCDNNLANCNSMFTECWATTHASATTVREHCNEVHRLCQDNVVECRSAYSQCTGTC